MRRNLSWTVGLSRSPAASAPAEAPRKAPASTISPVARIEIASHEVEELPLLAAEHAWRCRGHGLKRDVPPPLTPEHADQRQGSVARGASVRGQITATNRETVSGASDIGSSKRAFYCPGMTPKSPTPKSSPSSKHDAHDGNTVKPSSRALSRTRSSRLSTCRSGTDVRVTRSVPR
jgi:hypothetical protein